MARVRLGVNLGYWGAGPPPNAQELVLEAERLGYDSVWTAEAYGSDVLTPLAWWGARTERIRLGTALFQMSARAPTARGCSVASAAPDRKASASGGSPGRGRSQGGTPTTAGIGTGSGGGSGGGGGVMKGA